MEFELEFDFSNPDTRRFFERMIYGFKKWQPGAGRIKVIFPALRDSEYRALRRWRIYVEQLPYTPFVEVQP